ncbi:MAG: DUF3365 domain-containing protein [Melioribacteraceae bacterium]|nr:DUF3365 domain-containing protein [Melioribacteraceae bacterium]
MKKTILSILLIVLIIFVTNCSSSQKKRSIEETKETFNQEKIELGSNYVKATKSVLGRNLLSSLKKGGAENAISFCSEKAFTLTDSMATLQNIKIKRVSDKSRNPDNMANSSELIYIAISKNLLANNEKIKPQISEIAGKMVGYYPIITNKMCLQCHGEIDKDILPNTLAKIKTLYPQDKATGYGSNELRGIWVVEMEK